MSCELPDPEFFIDRSLGKYEVADAIAGRGYVVHTLASKFGEKRAQKMEDDEWIPYAAGHGWLCLMKDRIHYRPANRNAMLAAGARCFCLTNASLTGPDQTRYLLSNLNRIVQRGRKPGPYVYGVYESRLEKIWP